MDAPASKASADGDSLKETFESIVIAFILAFVFRAYVVEAFIIPTGSMAPTLLGEHVRVRCQQCGYRFTADVDETERLDRRLGARVKRPYVTTPTGLPAVCPICQNPNLLTSGTWINSGDRILVHKYLYSFAEPRRWDVVVFKNPQEPHVNFIKRLVGLPGEELLIVEGNIYTRRLDAVPPGQEDEWRIQRKSERPKVQRTLWQPLYHSQYVPLDRGDPGRNPDRRSHPWSLPWQVVTNPEQWNLSNDRGYLHASDDPGTIRFVFNSAAGRPRYTYNQFKDQRQLFEDEPVEDIRLTAVVEAHSPGLSLTLQTTARWDGGDADRPTPIIAHIDPQGLVSIKLPQRLQASTGRPVTLASGRIKPFEAGAPRQVELWYVDQEVSVWVDGRRILAAGFELPMRRLEARPPLEPGYTPDVRILVGGAAVRLHRVELDRDIYYSSSPGLRRPEPGLGGMTKIGARRLTNPAAIAPDQFFCLGDNSPLSHDGRYWQSVDPWIAQRMFSGEPITGLVPRDLMIGRAFFVYWPGMHQLQTSSRPLLPNFGDMRFIH